MPRFIPLFDGYSIEATTKDTSALGALGAPGLAPAQVFVPWLPEESDAARIAACAAVREAGLRPVPHLSARRIASLGDLDALLGALRDQADARDLFVVAGDLAAPCGPFADSLGVIRSGLIERHGFTHVGIAGHPDGHPDVPATVLWQAMQDKIAALDALGLHSQIVTQFAFDAGQVLQWLGELRRRGVTAPVRIGIPGPASVRALLRFAARCGVAASAGVVGKYGLSLTRLLGNAGPDRFLDGLQQGLDAQDYGAVQLHVFPFGGFAQFGAWLAQTVSPPVF
jgi:methylenetetrahydrofolate reductase (NADPH)